VTGRRGRRLKQLPDDLKEMRLLETEIGSTRSCSVENCCVGGYGCLNKGHGMNSRDLCCSRFFVYRRDYLSDFPECRL
jgi:hypothetical protein